MMTSPRFFRCGALAAWVIGYAALAAAQAGPPTTSVHWRFEKGADGQTMTTTLSEDGSCEAFADGEATVLSKEVPSPSCRSPATPTIWRCRFAADICG